MAVIAECPICKDRNSLKNTVCKKCGFSLKKASGKVYWINYRDPSGRLKFERIGTSKLAAENRQRDVKTAIVEGRYIDKNFNSKHTLGGLIAWYTNLTDTKSKKSHQRIKEVLANIKRVLGSNILISHLKPSQMESYKITRIKEPSKARKGKTVAIDTINKEISFCKAMLNKAVLEGEVESNPFANVKLLPVNNVRERVLTFDEFEELLKASKDYLKPIVAMAFFMPMRQAEILNLTWENVDLQRRLISLSAKMTKTKEGRFIKIHPRVIEIMARLPRGIRERKVFLKDGKSVSQRQIQRDYRIAVKDANLGDFTFHDLRHCAINNMRLAGNDYFMIMAQSGHKTMSVFKRYNLVSPTELDNTKWLDQGSI